MRIWDLPVEILCRKHLLGEHRELHAIWKILQDDRKAYRQHPEVQRWEGKLELLFFRHLAQVKEMQARGYKHKSPLTGEINFSNKNHLTLWETVETQKRKLKEKRCECQV